jgi:hypothetical protein
MMFGNTRLSQGIFHSLLSANILCISTQICTALSPGGPYRNLSLFDMTFPGSPVKPAANALVPNTAGKERGCSAQPD